ncbi:hypothetical protein HK102_013672, partial [Quaeritorhiza haematococci]
MSEEHSTAHQHVQTFRHARDAITLPSVSAWHWDGWKTILKSDAATQLLAGGIAGGVSRTFVSPLERTKILFQVQGPGRPAKYRGIWNTLLTIYREERVAGFFRGNGTNVLRIVPFSAIQFATYEKFKIWIKQPNQIDLTVAQRLIAGALAGMISVTATYPLDLIRTRLTLYQRQRQVYRNPLTARSTTPKAPKPPGIVDTFWTIYRTEGGVFGLWRGLFPTIL